MSWKDITAKTITEAYLYGEKETPNGDGFLDNELIRDGVSNNRNDSTVTISLTKEDFYDYMTASDSPTRFASVTQIPVVQKFFNSDLDWEDGNR